MTKIFNKQKENTTHLIVPDDTTSIVYQPLILFCFLIWNQMVHFCKHVWPQFSQYAMCSVCSWWTFVCWEISLGFCIWLVHWFSNSTMTAEVGVPWDEIVICGELLKTGEKVVVACLEAQFRNLLGCTEEEHDEYHQCKQCLNQSSNHVPYEYKWGMLLIWLICGGTWWHIWFRHCATSQKVLVSIPDGVIVIFHWPNPSGHTVALESTHPLTEMSTTNICLLVKAANT